MNQRSSSPRSEPGVIDLLLLFLAALGLSGGFLTSGPEDSFDNIRAYVENKYLDDVRGFDSLQYLVNCVMCLTLWAAVPLVLLWLFRRRAFYAVAIPLAAWRLSVPVHDLLEREWV